MPRYLTIKQVAEQFSVDETTVYRLVNRRHLPAFKVGGQWRFSQEALADWVRRQTVRPPAGRSTPRSARPSRR